ncbi:MAG: YlbF family regulator [Phycisphaerales bacterium]|nr:YlbF family regulator [Phycisphaerales bacterium]
MPAELKDILEQAEKLGRMLADHPAVVKFKAAQKAVMEDSEARNAMSDFNRMLEALARQEQQGLSITDAQRLSLEGLQSRLASNLKVKALNIAQVELMDLLRKVSEAWQKPIGAPLGDAASAGPRIATSK